MDKQCIICRKIFETIIVNKITCSIECRKIKDKNYYKNNKNKFKEYYEKNKEQILKNMKEYRMLNPEKYIGNKYYYIKKSIIRYNILIELDYRQYLFTKEFKRQVKQVAYRRKYESDKRRKNIQFRIKENCHKKLKYYLFKCKNIDKYIELINCTSRELRQHFEILFKEDMNWNNHSFEGWHIDCIVPCRNFNLSIEDEKLMCFCYSNLQPLWKDEHLRKE